MLFIYLQHLIEMLNRNQHYSSQLHDLEQEQEEEQQEQRHLRQEEEEREKLDAAAAQRRHQVIEAQRRYEEDILRQEREKQKLVDVAPFTNGADGDNDNDGHKEMFGFTAGMSPLTQTKESLEQGTTQPFSPKASASFEYTGVTMVTSSSGTRGEAVSIERNDLMRQETSVTMATSSSGTRSEAVSMERNDVMRQETSEDVGEIEEDIVDNVEAENQSDSDDGFNF